MKVYVILEGESDGFIVVVCSTEYTRNAVNHGLV